MLCHGSCGANLTPKEMFTRTLECIAREAGVNVLELEEYDLQNGTMCHNCALFRAAVGEKWQTYAYTLELLQMQQSRVRVVDGKILLPLQTTKQSVGIR